MPRATRSVQLHISQDAIEKYMFSENELSGGLTVDVTLDDDTVMIDVWCVDASKNEEIIIESGMLKLGVNNAQGMFLWAICTSEVVDMALFLGMLTCWTSYFLML